MNSRKKNNIRLISLILAAVLMLSLISGAMIAVYGAGSKQIEKELLALREEQDKIEAESNRLEANIAANKQKTQTIVEQKADIDQQMEMSRQKIENLNEQIRQYNLLIAEKQKELEQAMAEEDALMVQYKTRLRTMEESGDISYWSILFKANSFSDLLDRVDMIHEIAASDQLMLQQLAEVTSAVEQERLELEQQRLTLEETEAELDAQRVTLEEQRTQADALILQMKAEYDALSDEYKAALAEEEAMREQIKKTETAYYNALAKEKAEREAANQQSGGSSGGGSFAFPLAYSTGVTSAYGPRIHPVNGNQSFHYGVDFAAGMNTQIYATKSGTVSSATYGTANGYYVVISHGDGYSSLYAHMTNYVVSPGDKVKQGQLIGYVGTTGWSTGPHLHFEILYNGSNVNPMNYVSLP